MRYWLFALFALVGGIVLINSGLSEFVPLESRIALVAGILSLGAARRMLQQRLHR